MSLSNILEKPPETDEELKTCCANLYENEIVKFFLGESFHPGGIELTLKLAEKLNINENKKVLDIASGLGTSSIEIAKKFNAHITGLDYSDKNRKYAEEKAKKEKVSNLTEFIKGDAEKLPFPDNSFDAIISECSFCTFPDKVTAAKEMYRVLKHGGMVGITDIILNEELPDKWKNHVSHILCLADAKSFEEYNLYFTKAGFNNIQNHDESKVFIKLSEQIRIKLMLAKIAVGLGKLSIPNFDVSKGKQYIQEGLDFINSKKGGYGMIIAEKSL